MSLVAVYIIES